MTSKMDEFDQLKHIVYNRSLLLNYCRVDVAYLGHTVGNWMPWGRGYVQVPWNSAEYLILDLGRCGTCRASPHQFLDEVDPALIGCDDYAI
jgi:hypothetical protein